MIVSCWCWVCIFSVGYVHHRLSMWWKQASGSLTTGTQMLDLESKQQESSNCKSTHGLDVYARSPRLNPWCAWFYHGPGGIDAWNISSTNPVLFGYHKQSPTVDEYSSLSSSSRIHCVLLVYNHPCRVTACIMHHLVVFNLSPPLPVTVWYAEYSINDASCPGLARTYDPLYDV